MEEVRGGIKFSGGSVVHGFHMLIPHHTATLAAYVAISVAFSILRPAALPKKANSHFENHPPTFSNPSKTEIETTRHQNMGFILHDRISRAFVWCYGALTSDTSTIQ